MSYSEKLKQAVSASSSTLCVGLDPNLDLLPEELRESDLTSSQQVGRFLKRVIDATSEHCAAYKPNLGFFEALGPKGWNTFEEILDYIPEEKVVIADAKRGDISSTAEHYAKAFFDYYDVDAITLNPLMGFETLDPFLDDASKSAYVLTLTSNPGAKDILMQKTGKDMTISSLIARRLQEKQKESKTSIGMVVGATKTSELKPVITQFSQAPLLIPGVGKQGGSVEELASVLKNHQGIPLINSSRSIIYAGGNSNGWVDAVAESAKNLKKRLDTITQQYV